MCEIFRTCWLVLTFADLCWVIRVRKSKNFPDSKIFHAKTFRIKRVNRDTFAFATKVRKTEEFHFCCQKCIKLDWMEPELSYEFLDNSESCCTIRTLSGLSRQFLAYPDSLWIVRTVSKWAGKFKDFLNSFWIVWKVSRLPGQFLYYPYSLWTVRTISKLSGKSLDCSHIS